MPMIVWSKAKCVGLGILLFAYAIIAGSIYLVSTHTLLWLSGVSTTGEIQGTRLVVADDHSAPNTTSEPSSAYIVSFVTSDGRETIFKTKFSSSFKLYSVGEKVTVLYRPDSPENAKILGFMSLYLGPLLSLFMGFVFWLIGTFMFRVDKPKWRYIKN